MFEKIDTNKDGRLSLEEISAAIHATNLKVEKKYVERLIDTIYEIGNDYISFDDFIKIMVFSFKKLIFY